MIAGASRPIREFRLDDERWLYRRDRARHLTWWAPWLLGISCVFLPLGILFWNVVILRWAFLLVFGFGFMISALPLITRFNDPVALDVSSVAVRLRWANGKMRELPFKPGIKFGLYDNTALRSGSTFTLKFSSRSPPRGAYLLLYAHSFRNEPYELTKEAFDAVRRELVARGAKLIREGPTIDGPTTVLTEYRLPKT